MARGRLPIELGARLLSLTLFWTPAGLAERLPIKTYTTADGLARDSINRIVSDTHGFLWFCTEEGLSRFDGYQFSNYTTADGLPHQTVLDFLESQRGDFWVATAGGLCRFNPKPARGPKGMEPRFTVYHPGNDRKTWFVRTLLEDHAGVIWCGTSGGLFRMDRTDNSWTFHEVDIGLRDETPDSRRVYALTEDRDGGLWIGSSGLIRRRPDGRTERYTREQGLPDDWVHSLFTDGDGQIWVGTYTGLVQLKFSRPALGSAIAFAEISKDGRRPYTVKRMVQASAGTIWLATTSGLIRLDRSAGGEWNWSRTYTSDHGLAFTSLGALAQDRDGNLWLGGLGGAMKLPRNGFTTYTHEDGLASAGQTMGLNGLGEAYFSANPGIIQSFRSGRFVHHLRLNIPPAAYVSFWGSPHLHRDRAGEWWAGTSQGLYRFPKADTIEQLARLQPKAVYTKKNGLEYNAVFRFYEDRKGDIWISTHDDPFFGLNRWERATGVIHDYTNSGVMPNLREKGLIDSFGEDHAGGLWMGLYRWPGGLLRYRDGRFKLFTAADGVPEGSIDQIYCDHAHRLWIATGGGAIRIDNPTADPPRFRLLNTTTVPQLSSNSVNNITEDRWGRIYFGTGRGIDRLDPETGQTKHYTSADGVPHTDLYYSFQDRAGTLWFSTQNHLLRLDPDRDPIETPPAIMIRGLRIAGQVYHVSDLGEAA